ncbi:DNA recombination protein RmuC [Helicobacter sp. 11S02596-1]|uniref:DNA recombination protein RmuC n=1 Tax=Helicobacter sp. 11S02596-1 TaxID=1476194 RepID=UPI000BA6C41D|nr:DNA recombination protein RmuC [Helicobacter sp. 11S02596-1]PAF43210.1 hypothetical protein BJI48_05555 [Helicobacter sp. 11S02596-1]
MLAIWMSAVVVLLLLCVGLGFLLALSRMKITSQEIYWQKAFANEQEKFQSQLQSQEAQNQAQKTYFSQRLDDERAKIEALKEELQNTEKIKKELKLEFENLSQKILENKTQDFHNSQTKTLAPLQKEIKDFKDAFENLKNEQTKERASLITEIKLLKDLNETISKEASNLTKALKGESKTRGNWGEMILESMLEKNGFIEGQNYRKQVDMLDEASGKHFQPDIIIDLPDDRVIIIDSKLNLNAYDALLATDSKEEADKQIKNLLANITTHFNELGKKKYHLLTKGKSPDFTIMFIPIEGAFIEAMRADTELFNKAYNLRVVITSPSTLMSILMTIANLWKNEQIDKDYRNIISKIQALQDKLNTFCSHMDSLGKGIETIQARYNDTNAALRGGRGNIMARVKTLTTSQAMPDMSESPNSLPNSL